MTETNASGAQVPCISLLAELIEAGDRLSPFLEHPRSCEWEMQGGKPCQCGLKEKWAAWEAAKRSANARGQTPSEAR
jgi:hypothetical protein